MKPQNILYIALFLLTGNTALKGQYYDTGQDPASLKWEKITTEHFIFIYPVTYRSEASRASILYEKAYSLLRGTMNEPPLKRFPVIIHNYSVESNGYVAWAPRRMELFPLPPQDNLPMDHHQQLALHELTHVLQMQALSGSLSKPLSLVFGQQYPGALAVYTPSWYLEGDAVVSESVYSLSGRGRAPAFEKQLKAMLLEGNGSFSYDKMINGSFRDYTPDHYQFGYQMSAMALAQYGPGVWSDALTYTAGNPYSLNPFNLSLRKNYGITKGRLYSKTMDHLYSLWSEEEKERQFTTFDTLNPGKANEYVSYYSPVAIPGNRIAAIRSSLSGIPQIVSIDPLNGTTRVLHTPGYMWPMHLSSSGKLLCWAENRYDPRWANRGYSVVRVMDMATGRVSSLSDKSRYFSPALSHDATRIAVAESTPEYINSLVIIDAATGAVLQKVSLPDNILPSMPAWSDDDRSVIFISSSEQGEGIMAFNTVTGVGSEIIPQGRDDLESVTVIGDTIFFTSSFSGTDNVYAIPPEDKPVRVTSVRFGVSDLSAWGQRLLFADYSSSGNNIGVLDTGSELHHFSDTSRRWPAPVQLIDSEEKLVVEPGLPAVQNVEIQPYRKWKHPFNFHSWMPFWTDVNNISFDNLVISPGLTLMSQNHLSTLVTTLGYQYSEGDHLFHSNLSWRGWYPAVDLDITYGGTPSIIQESNIGAEPSTVYPGMRVTGTIFLPLHFNNGRFNQTLWPSFRLSYNNNYVYESDAALYDYGQFLASSRLYLSNLHRMSVRDIWPRLGQVVDINHTFSPSDPGLYGPVLSFRGQLYFPGVAANHSARITLQAEKKEFRKLLLSNRITLPRGYSDVIPEKVSSAGFDYAMPLASPDLRLGGLIYLQRIRTTLFYDYASASENYYYLRREMVHETEIFDSFGTELVADWYLLRIPFRLSTGVQAAWLPARKEPWFSLIFNVDVFGFVLGDRPRN